MRITPHRHYATQSTTSGTRPHPEPIAKRSPLRACTDSGRQALPGGRNPCVIRKLIRGNIVFSCTICFSLSCDLELSFIFYNIAIATDLLLTDLNPKQSPSWCNFFFNDIGYHLPIIFSGILKQPFYSFVCAFKRCKIFGIFFEQLDFPECLIVRCWKFLFSKLSPLVIGQASIIVFILKIFFLAIQRMIFIWKPIINHQKVQCGFNDFSIWHIVLLESPEIF